jgi:hypothetical protein
VRQSKTSNRLQPENPFSAKETQVSKLQKFWFMHISIKDSDINHLPSIMLRLSLDGRLRKSMGFGSRKLVEDKLSWDAIANQYNAVYTKVVNNSNLCGS